MVRFAVELPQLNLAICAHRPEYLLQALEVCHAEDLPAPLGDEHQVCMKQENNVTPLAYFHGLDQSLKCSYCDRR